MNLIVERAVEMVENLAQARSRRAFLSALEHFERVLALAASSWCSSASGP